ncbi:sensor histidine kinase [Paenibacillus albiflavus]|uniref:histidine kinase n=1 Tax=Paenibacillus albiflavus TaxID=2545760 RepID=A0A4R4EFV8_9BACL|nr:sensor histidine kinase [Paenibacillus albiflavus]TCZ77121.1 sensor histidine kinase [Paenibacillus albiflavus]
MKSWLDKSLKRKLLLLLLIAVVLPQLVTGVVSYRMASSVTEEKEKLSGMNTLKQINDKIDFVIRDVESMSIFLIGQKDIQTYLSNDYEDANSWYLNTGFLSNLAFTKKYISNITLTSLKNYSPLSNTTIFESGLTALLENNEKANDKWWTPLYENMTADGLKRVISLVRPIRSLNTFKPLGRLSISIDENEIRGYLTNSGWESKGYVVLIDEHNRILSSANQEWLNKSIEELLPGLGPMDGKSGSFAYRHGEVENTILYSEISKLGWKLIGVIPMEIYTAQNQYVLGVTAVAVGISLVFSIIVVIFFILWVTRPLTVLSRTMKDINPDEALPTYVVKSKDEVGLLLHSFNKLSDRIQRLKVQVQMNEALKKEADIMALQAQINPHFLYNTLSSIHWMALMSKEKQIAEMVGALSDFLRFSLNKGEEFCPVQQEVAHARNYSYIMSIRFQEKFDVVFYIDPELNSKRILKLLLQPLIENSIMHGIQKKKEFAHVYVHGKLHGQTMIFVVEDTGIGIEPDQLQKIHRQLSEMDTDEVKEGRAGYGLRNVHKRLLLHYGNDTGLVIESEAGVGTRISFTIPLMEDAT